MSKKSQETKRADIHAVRKHLTDHPGEFEHSPAERETRLRSLHDEVNVMRGIIAAFHATALAAQDDEQQGWIDWEGLVELGEFGAAYTKEVLEKVSELKDGASFERMRVDDELRTAAGGAR